MTSDYVTSARSARPWRIRPYLTGDEQQLLALFERTYGRSRSLEEWRWKFMASRGAGSVPSIWVAELPGSERLVGHYAGIPLTMKIGDRTVKAMLSVETMTDPDYRRQGMLTKFGEVVYDSWASAGLSLIIGLPNQQWGSRKEALGWAKLFPLAWLRFPLHPELAFTSSERLPRSVSALARVPLSAAGKVWLALLKRRASRLAQGDLVCQHYGPEAGIFDRIWAHAAPSWTNAVVRDDAWVRWRYLDATPGPYTVIVAWRAGNPTGYIAFRVRRTSGSATGYIADIFTALNDRATIAALVAAALDSLDAQKVGVGLTLAVPGTALYRALRGLGFFQMPHDTSFSFEVVTLDGAISASGLSRIDDWNLAGGDSDVI